MTALVAVLGLLVSPALSALVYWDAARLGRTRSACVAWAICVGVISFAGFLASALAGGALARVYLVWVKGEPIVTAPREILGLYVAVGLATSVLALALYGIDRGRARR
ncbi:hypothetical protein [Haloplanus halobius]|uniref:hypothetical protein n=1 Tax=Haloplanus halobius TaxID=2934938 RepID=UPI00200F0ABB|nr:hypothetical protein [Haloplanus sp. XH21]